MGIDTRSFESPPTSIRQTLVVSRWATRMKKVFYIIILFSFSRQILGQNNKQEIIKGFDKVTFYSDSTIKSASLGAYCIEFNEHGQAIGIGKCIKDKKNGWWIKPNNTCDYYIDGYINMVDLTPTCNTTKPSDFQGLYFNIINKADCKTKLETKIKNLNGEWKFASAVFYPTKGEKESQFYPDHYLFFNKNTFAVQSITEKTRYQSGKIRIEKQNSSKALNCDCQVWFKSKISFNPFDTLGYFDFWTINKCTVDSLILYSPWNCEFITPNGEQKRCGMVEKYFIRQK